MKATRIPNGTAALLDSWWPLLALTLLCAPLFLYGLGDTLLWGDEGHTLLLGRSVLENGVPLTSSGPDSLSVSRGGEAGVFGLHVQIPFLQAYVAAASIAALGETPFAARLPFALAGLLCVPLAFAACRSHTKNASVALIAGALVGLNPFFVLYARQARYYPMAALLVLAVLAVPAVPQRWRPHVFTACLILLVLTFDPTALGALVALAVLGVSPLRLRLGLPSRQYWWGLATGSAALALWLLVAATASSRPVPDIGTVFVHGLPFHAFYTNSHMFPGVLVVVLGVMWWIRHRRERPQTNVSARALTCFLVVGAAIVACAALPPDRFVRYAVPAAPVFAMALAILLVEGIQPRRYAAFLQTAVVVATLLLTNAAYLASDYVARASLGSLRATVFHAPEAPKIPLRHLLRELWRPPRGPIHGVVDFLDEHALPGDTLVVTYGDLALRAQTSLDVYGFFSGMPGDDVEWDWIWMRNAQEGPLDTREAFHARMLEVPYRRHELQVRDRRWENRPDPHLHVYSDPGPDAPPVVLWERIR